MSDKSLFDLNPSLRDPDRYEQFLVINVGSSAAIELGGLPVSILRTLTNASAKSHTRLRRHRASSGRSR